MRFILSVLVVLLLAGVRPGNALAWGYDGHRIVCAIAWEQMKPEVRAKVSFILEAEGKDAFVENCLWPDEVRPWRKETGPYHYVNVPRGATAFEPARDCTPEVSCVSAQALIQAGEMRRAFSRDALRFAAHFIGDMHQPLHAGYADDLGGNLTKGKFMGRDTNMHGLWDYGLLEATGRPWREIAADLNSRITQADRWAWGSGTPTDWMKDTLALAQSTSVGYGNPYTPAVPFDLGADYLQTNLPTIYLQLQKAGVRTADILSNFLQ